MDQVNYETVLRLLLHRLGSEVLIIDTKGRIVFRGRGSGTDKTESMGQHLLDVFPALTESDGDIDWELEIFTHLLREGRELEVRHQSRKIGQNTHWFDLIAFPLKEQETITGAVLILLDMSERHALEEKLIRQARTQSLANLGASIAHEIRNPLNAMALNIQLVNEGILKPESTSVDEQTANLNLILEEIKRLDGIVSNFLQFARPPKATFSLDNPNRAVESVVTMLREQARKKGIELTATLGNIPEVLMDKNRLVEALYNITQNAVQALGENGKVALLTGTEDDKVIIRIIDNGPGIPDDMQEKIFELYFSTKEEGSGTGLGLPYADSIIKSHNGTLRVSSAIGKGTTFTILLPTSIMTGRQES